MSNPYEPPSAIAARARPRALSVTLAAFAGFAASAYWAALTLLLAFAAANGSISGAQVILPIVLIVLYGLRGWQLWQGDRAAATRLLWLHAIGGLMAIVQMGSGGQLILVMQGVKLAIHVGGVATTLSAQRALAEAA